MCHTVSESPRRIVFTPFIRVYPNVQPYRHDAHLSEQAWCPQLLACLHPLHSCTVRAVTHNFDIRRTTIGKRDTKSLFLVRIRSLLTHTQIPPAQQQITLDSDIHVLTSNNGLRYSHPQTCAPSQQRTGPSTPPKR